jgi:hypothetical protein
MLLTVIFPARIFLTLTVLVVIFYGCSKEKNNTSTIEYQLDASDITADHFYVRYLNEHLDTVFQHQHTGWRYSFSTARPAKAFLEAQVYPVDKYIFTIKILKDGKVVQQDSASTFTGTRKSIRIAYTPNP